MKTILPLIPFLLIASLLFSQSPIVSKTYVEGTFASYIFNTHADSSITTVILVPDLTQPSGYLSFSESDSTFIRQKYLSAVHKAMADTLQANTRLRNAQADTTALRLIEIEFKTLKNEQ